MVIDLKNCENDNDFVELRNKYINGEYPFAFEDFNRIEMNNPQFLSSKIIVNGDNGFEEQIVTDESDNSRALLVDNNCSEVRAFLYMPPVNIN